MSTISSSCENCGDKLIFNVKEQIWLCESCGNRYKFDDLSHAVEYDEFNNYKHFECKNCGAVVISNNATLSTVCTYCERPLVLVERLVHDSIPDYILPVKHKEEEILNHLNKYRKKHLLTPTNLFSKPNLQSIKMIYIPCWIISGTVKLTLKINGAINGHWSNFENTLTTEFVKTPIVASAGIELNIFKGLEPFDYDSLKKFSYHYLMGFEAETYEEDKEDKFKYCVQVPLHQILREKLIYNNCYYDRYKFEGEDFACNNLKYEYALLPIWIVRTNYNNQQYVYYINDNTLKVAGKYPIKKSKEFLAYSSIIIGAVIAISLIILFASDVMKFINPGLAIAIVLIVASVLVVITHNATKLYDEILKDVTLTDYIDIEKTKYNEKKAD